MLSTNQAAIVLLAMNSVPLGVATYSVYHQGQLGGQDSSAEVAGGPILKLDGMVVHLKPADDEHVERYASIEFDFELGAEQDRSVIIQNMSRIRESIIGYFADHTAAELQGVGALGQMKSGLVARLNGTLPKPKIRALYVGQFVIQ